MGEKEWRVWAGLSLPGSFDYVNRKSAIYFAQDDRHFGMGIGEVVKSLER